MSWQAAGAVQCPVRTCGLWKQRLVVRVSSHPCAAACAGPLIRGRLGQCRAQSRSQAGRSVVIGAPEDEAMDLDADPEEMPGLNEQMFLGDDDLSDEDVYGPPAVLLAGFPPEELGMVRATLDQAGGHEVKVVPCMGAMLHATVDEALQAPEPAWNQRRPDSWGQPGGFSTHRVVLFSGMSLSAQASVVELLEDAGVPSLSLAIAEPANGSLKLGSVMAKAVQEQRSRYIKNSADTDYSKLFASPATSKEVQDMSTRGIEDMVQRMMRGEGADEDVNPTPPPEGFNPRNDPVPEPMPPVSQPENAQTQSAGHGPSSIERDPMQLSQPEPKIEPDPSPQEKAEAARQQMEASRERSRQAWASSKQASSSQQTAAPDTQSRPSVQGLPEDQSPVISGSVQSIRGPSPVEELPVSPSSQQASGTQQSPVSNASYQQAQSLTAADSIPPSASQSQSPDPLFTSKTASPASRQQATHRTFPKPAESQQTKAADLAAESGDDADYISADVRLSTSAGDSLPHPSAADDSPSASDTQQAISDAMAAAQEPSEASPSAAAALGPAEKAREAARAAGSLGRRPWLQKQTDPPASSSASTSNGAPVGTLLDSASLPLSTGRNDSAAFRSALRKRAADSALIQQQQQQQQQQEAVVNRSFGTTPGNAASGASPQASQQSNANAGSQASSASRQSMQQQAESLREGQSSPDLMPELQAVLQNQQIAVDAPPTSSASSGNAGVDKASAPIKEGENEWDLLDAAASGRDISARLGSNGRAGTPVVAEPVLEQEQHYKPKSPQEQQLLEAMKQRAQALPPTEQDRLAMELEMLKDEKGQYERIMQELTQKFKQMDTRDQAGLVNKMKLEAVEPTQDAIKAALSCGISGAEIKRMVDELEADSSSWATSWSRLPDLSPEAWKKSGVEKGL